MATRPGEGDIAVALDRVSKRFGKISALDDVSLAVRRGELITLLGPSGCGKTTLLNLVAGFLAPEQGEIAIAGRRVTDVPTYRREIGIMFQSYALFPHMSVAANVGYGLKMRRLARSEIAQRVAETLGKLRMREQALMATPVEQHVLVHFVRDAQQIEFLADSRDTAKFFGQTGWVQAIRGQAVHPRQRLVAESLEAEDLPVRLGIEVIEAAAAAQREHGDRRCG
jgi:hypothetical protein